MKLMIPVLSIVLISVFSSLHAQQSWKNALTGYKEDDGHSSITCIHSMAAGITCCYVGSFLFRNSWRKYITSSQKFAATTSGQATTGNPHLLWLKSFAISKIALETGQVALASYLTGIGIRLTTVGLFQC
jgi:hypothetical protein